MRTLSVIICTCNRSQSLSKTLDSLLHQKNNGAFDCEVIVIDNNSKDDTRKVVDSFVSLFQGKLNYVFEPTQGKPYALNRGIREAKGEIIAFTDDDVIIDPQWLKEILICFERHDCDGVGGRVLPIYPTGTPRWIMENPRKIAGGVVICDFGDTVKKFEKSMEKFLGANWAFKKSVFETCGLFRTDLYLGKTPLGEDTEFMERLIRYEKSLYYCGKAAVWHPVDKRRLTLRHIAQWNYTLGRLQTRKEKENRHNVSRYLCGIPGYLIAGVIIDLGRLFFYLFYPLQFLNSVRALSRKVGMIVEYRAMLKKKRGAAHAES